MRVLLVEDELFLANLTMKEFKNHNINVENEYNGEKALELILNEYYDVVILDIMLPGLDGISILREMRAKNIDVPVIMTSAKSSIADKVEALELGADDYLTKPYDFAELFVRIKTNLRRHSGTTLVSDNQFGDLTYERNNLSIVVGSNAVNLTLTEYNILEYLINNEKQAISKEQIIEKVWGYDADVLPNHVEVYISYIRKKLKLLNSRVQIKTIRGVGYRIEDTNV